MKRRQLIQSLAMTLLGSGAILTSRANAAPAPGEPDKGKRLSVGQTLRFDSDLSVTFLAVLEDGRCPINAICTSAGNAVVSLRVKVAGQKPKIVSLHTDSKKKSQIIVAKEYPDGMAGIPKSYIISIASLTPLPFAGKRTRQSDYRLKLAIGVAV